jgi:anti-sigma B factor antagonist
MSDHVDERAADFRLEVEHEHDASIVAVIGDVDLYSAPELREQLATLVDAGTDRVVVDLTECTFLDSMGLGVLVGAKKRMVERDGRIDLVVPTPQIRRIFEITMLDEIFGVYESREAARA